MNDTLGTKKANQHASDLDLLIFAFFHLGEVGMCHDMLWCLISGSYSKTRFVISNNLFQKVKIIFNQFQKITTPFTSNVLLILKKIFRNHFCADFPYALFFHQNLMNDFGIQIQPFFYHSNSHLAIRSQEISNSVDIFNIS